MSIIVNVQLPEGVKADDMILLPFNEGVSQQGDITVITVESSRVFPITNGQWTIVDDGPLLRHGDS